MTRPLVNRQSDRITTKPIFLHSSLYAKESALVGIGFGFWNIGKVSGIIDR